MTAVDVAGLTTEYERWLGAHIPLVAADLRAKHEEMAASVLRFLRGTYYLWLYRAAELLPALATRTRVPAVGDLHIENFGTWRDHRRKRRWGVNDLDELAWGNPALDLVRLATSAVLAPGVALSTKELCRLLLDEWRTASAGTALDMGTGAARHLRVLVPVPASANRYYTALADAPPADPETVHDVVRTAVEHTVGEGWRPTWHWRRAGTGSLGHPRIHAVGRDGRGRWQAREVKLLGPATVTWLRDRVPPADLPIVDDLLYGRVVAAVRGPEPSRRVHGWQVRRLAPDVVRIDLSGLRTRDAQRMVRSMARAVVGVHGVAPAAFTAARAESGVLDGDRFRDAVELMAADTRESHRAWRQHHG